MAESDSKCPVSGELCLNIVMDARTALGESDDKLIGSATPNGLATIFQSAGRRDERYLLRFIPRYGGGAYNTAGTVMFGSYNSLAGAVDAASAAYGISELDWLPTRLEDLPKGHGHAPEIRGRKFVQPGDG